MLCVVVLLPAVMIAFGGLWQRRPPKEINDVYGYRTAMSMKSQETWHFAHRYCGRIWLWSGWAVLLPSAAVLFVYRTDAALAVGWIVCVQVVVMLLAIPPTEIALRRHFDKDGWHKESRKLHQGRQKDGSRWQARC